jgi:hypothetical protein
MSLGSVFSGAGKQAQQAASGFQAVSQNLQNQMMDYTNNATANERGAISGLSNPYYNAVSPSLASYAVNPNDVNSFGQTPGPGDVSGNSVITPSTTPVTPLPGSGQNPTEPPPYNAGNPPTSGSSGGGVLPPSHIIPPNGISNGNPPTGIPGRPTPIRLNAFNAGPEAL